MMVDNSWMVRCGELENTVLELNQKIKWLKQNGSRLEREREVSDAQAAEAGGWERRCRCLENQVAESNICLGWWQEHSDALMEEVKKGYELAAEWERRFHDLEEKFVKKTIPVPTPPLGQKVLELMDERGMDYRDAVDFVRAFCT